MPKLVDLVRRKLCNQKGDAVIIFTSIMMVVFAGFVALVLETGDLLYRKHIVQAAADASALSAASTVESIINFNPETMSPAPHPDTGQKDNTIIKTDDTGGGEAKVNALQILDYNKSLMEFDRKGIVLDSVTITGSPRQAVETYAGMPINITNMDGTVDTYYRNYGVILNGYMDAPLWGVFFGNDKAYFSIPAGASPRD